MVWPSRDFRTSFRSKDAAVRGPKRRRRGTRLAERSQAMHSPALESLESRALLAVTPTFNATAGTLAIAMNALDDAAVLSIDGSGNYLVNGSIVTDGASTANTTNVTGGITVSGSASADSFSFIGLSALASKLNVARSVDVTTISADVNITQASAGISIASPTINLGSGTTSITTAGAQTFSGDVNLGGKVTLSAGAITFTSKIDGSFDLMLYSSGLTTFGGAVGSTTPLASLMTDAAGTTVISGLAITTSGNQAYNDTVTLGADAVLEGQDGFFAGVTGNTKKLTLNFAGSETIDGATWTSLGSLKTDASGTTNLKGSITTSGAQFYGAAVVLKLDTILDAGDDVTFSGSVNGGFGLTVNSPGVTTFGGQVGTTSVLSRLVTDLFGSTTVSGGRVKTTGNQTFNDRITLTNATTLEGNTPTFAGGVDAGNNDLTLNFSGVTTIIGSEFDNLASLTTDAAGSTVLSGTITSGGVQTYKDLVTLSGATILDGGGSVVFKAPVTGDKSLAVTATGGTTLAANVTTAGDQSYSSAVTLAADVTLVGASPTFSAGVTGANYSLTLNFTGTTAINGAFQGIKNLATGNGGATQLAGDISTAGTQTYGDAVTLIANTKLTSTTGADIAFSSMVNGGYSLDVATAGNTVFGAAIGGSSSLTSVSTDAAGTAFLGGSVTTSGAQAFRGAVVLTANVTASSTGNSPISFGSTVDGGHSLTVNTTGSTTFAGDVAIASLTTDGGAGTSFSGGTVATTGSQFFNDAVSYGAPSTVVSASDVTFKAGADAGTNDLSIHADSGAITSTSAAIRADHLTLISQAGANVKTVVTALDATVLSASSLKIDQTGDIQLGQDANVTTIGGAISVTASGKVVIGQAIDAGAAAVSLAAVGGVTSLLGSSTPSVSADALVLVNKTSGTIDLPKVAVSSLSVTQGAAESVDVTNSGSLTIGVGSTGVNTQGTATITAENGSITLAQPSSVTAGESLRFVAPLGITQTATGKLSGAGTLDVTTHPGSGAVFLTNTSGNAIQNLTGSTNGGDFSYFTSGDLVVSALNTRNGDVTITSGSASDVTLDGAIASGTGSVTITSTAGGQVLWGAGSITTNGGDVSLTTVAGGKIDAPGITTNGGDVAVSTLAGGDITTQDIDSKTGRITLTTSGSAADIDTTAGELKTTSGAVTLSTGSGGDITLKNVTTAGGIHSYTTGVDGNFNSTAGVLASGGGTIKVTAAGTGSVTTGEVASNGGGIRLDAGSQSATAIWLKGDISALTTGRITLASSGGIYDDTTAGKTDGQQVTAGQLVVERSNGVVTLTNSGNSISALDLINTSAALNRIVSGSPNLQIGVAGLATHPTPGITTASGDVSIAVGGNNITALSDALITMGNGTLTLEAQAITLNKQSHNVAFIAGAFYSLDIKTADTLTVTQGIQASDGLVVDGLRAGSAVQITSGGGVTQTTDASIESISLSITAINSIGLPHDLNKVDSVFFSTPDTIIYNDFDDLTISGINGNTTTQAGDTVITAGADISQPLAPAAAAIYASKLDVTAADGSIALINSSNDVEWFIAQSGPSQAIAPVGISFRDANDVKLGNVLADDTPLNGGYVFIKVGGSITLSGELGYDTDTPGSLVLEHGSGGTTTFVVTSTGDIVTPDPDAPAAIKAAALTLRQRINYLNDNAVIAPQDEYITFNIDQFFPISLDTQLPTIERKVTLGPDKADVTDPDYRIALDGSSAVHYVLDVQGHVQFDADGNPITDATPVNGITLGYGNTQGLGSNGSVIRGLVVYGFTGSAVVLNSSGNTVTNNWIGITRGSETKGNGAGIEIVSSKLDGTTVLASSNTVDANVISGNKAAGILIRDQATLNTVVNNLIGTNAYGTIPIGNAGYGIEIVGANRNAIGAVGQGNTIVNNGSGGIKISGALTSGTTDLANTVLGNTIGNNTGHGIEIVTSLGNVIGSNATGAGNTIQDNTGAGISITGARATSLAAGNIVQANTISLNDLGGIVLENAAFQTISGGNEIMSNGVFATKTGAGIEIRTSAAATNATDNVILGNFIGTTASGAVDAGNADAGIILTGAVNTVIGTATAGDGNVIMFNRRDGVRVENGVDGADIVVAAGNRIRGNTVRYNSTLGDDSSAGVSISGGSRNLIGGTNAGEGNVISDNKAHGIRISLAANASYADGNRVARNTINANELDGVVLSGSSYQSIDSANLITANGRDGISLAGASSNNRILGNRIGIDASNLAAGNERDGIRVAGATGTVIGDATVANRNVISANGAGAGGGNGIFVTSAAQGTVIRNNHIGLDADGGAAGNAGAGIRVEGADAALITGLVIGGTAANEGNVISGNGLAGIVLEKSDGAIVRGNRIGTNVLGTLASDNGGSGIEIIAGNGNVVGGTTTTAANLISGNSASGVIVNGGTSHAILGNRIGTDAAGTAAIANLLHGIAVDGADTTVTIGGTVVNAANTIAGNSIDGINIANGKATVLGNYIGTNSASSATLANGGDGIQVSGGTGTAVGDGTAPGRNVISGNAGRGLYLAGGAEAVVRGNYVGTNVAGTAMLANALAGIRIEGASGATVSEGNVVSGNAGNGIELVGAGTVATTIAGNRIGTNAAGAAALTNGAAGIALISAGAADNANRNTIGGLDPNVGNLISGNTSHGIAITGSTNALVAQNTIGLDLNGNALGNAGSGVAIASSTDIDVTYRNQIAGNSAHGVLVTGGSGNSIGADAAQNNKGLANGNTITRNKLDGIRIDGGATGTIVAANTIGGSGLGNGGRGVTILASSGNTIGGGTVAGVAYGNLVVGNSSDGVGILNTPAANSTLGNTIRVNLGRGILVDNSDAQLVGGTGVGEGNTLVLNKVHGIELRNDADANIISGNFIGTTSSLGGGLGNSGAGVRIAGGSSQNNALQSNRVQGNALGGVILDGAVGNAVGAVDAGNTIVLNKVAGVSLIGNASLNAVSGNFIGTDAAGTSLGNVGDGVSVQGSIGNTIGGVVDGAGNTIRANQVGVNLVNAVAANLGAGNLVAGNTVDANLREGIRLFASSFNTIGDDDAANTVMRNTADGIVLAIGSSSNLVQGNMVGGSVAGNANRGAGIRVVGSNQNTLRTNTVSNNLANGIVVAGSAKTTIGGSSSDGNTVSTNRGDGILLTEAATQTTIQSNEVSANTGNGISVQQSTGNMIGAVGRGNTVIDNGLDGILVASVSASTIIQANTVGEVGDATLANGANGIRVAGAFGTLIGGRLFGEGNTIGNNAKAGIAVEAVASRTAAAATSIYGNTFSNSVGAGVAVAGSTNQIIGGTVNGQANTFSGNAVGIQITGGSTGTLVTGNTIDSSATHGVSIVGSIGNMVSGNTITRSAGDGVRVAQAAAKTLAAGNRVVNNSLLSNAGAGVRLTGGTSFTTVGAAGLANTIGSNASGVVIEGASTNNVVANNLIGTNAKSDVLGNTGAGIEVSASLTNVVQANTVANNATGIRVANALAKTAGAGNQILGNAIRASSGNGIEVVGGGRHTIGGTAAGTANTITTNVGSGIAISADTNGVGSVGNVIRGNSITANTASGISVSGGSLNEVSSGNVIRNNGADGISVAGSSLNTIGGAAATAGNTISGNTSNGVALSASSTGNLIAGNTISTNTKAGVSVSGAGSQNNVIGMRVVGGSSSGRGNTISSNTGGGVVVDAAVRNQIFANLMSGNTYAGKTTTEAGIVLSTSGNGNAATPTLSAATFARKALTIAGTISGAASRSSYWIDIFSNGTDSATAQAKQPLGRVLVKVGAGGAFTATLTLPTGTFVPSGTLITVTATDTFGNTSAISAAQAVS